MAQSLTIIYYVILLVYDGNFFLNSYSVSEDNLHEKANPTSGK